MVLLNFNNEHPVLVGLVSVTCLERVLEAAEIVAI